MDNNQLKNICKTLFDSGVEIYLQTKPGKWYESEYELNKDDIKLSTIYGIAVNGSTSIDFDFKTGKSPESTLKTFVTQFISKYETKQYSIIDGEYRKPTKPEVLARLKNNNRVSKYFFYTTLYGIGYFSMFMRQSTFNETNEKLSEYLNDNNIEFSNEFSDAGWVYRFVINQDVDTHNNLLNNFKL